MSSFTGVNDLTDLTNFLVEKVQQYDPTIDVSTGSAFYSSVVQPLIDRLGPDPYDTPLRDFILRRLKTEFPDLVLQDGEPLDDYAVKIMTVLLEPFRRQIRQVSNNQSLSNPELLNEKEADNLGANFFVRRKPGGYSVGIARLYYSAPRNSLITPNNVTKDGAGHRFIPVQNQLISADNMLFNIENNLYFFDVVVRAEQQGKEYNIPFNTLTAIEAAPEVVKISNKAAFEEGDDKESTINFVARVEESLTEKSLVTFRGIRARLTDVFESVRIIQTIGFGDPEMKRDIMTGSGETAPYAYFIGSAVASQRYVTLNTGALIPFLTEAGISYVSFTDGGVKVGDYIELSDLVGGVAIQVLRVEEITSPTKLLLSADILGNFTAKQFTLRRGTETLTISDIPGGILQPTTQAGTIEIHSNEVHIGGMLDVFIRASSPQLNAITLEGILDGKPLQFGTDLETFGGHPDPGEYIHITEAIPGAAMRPGIDRYGVAVNNILLVSQYTFNSPYGPDQDLSTIPWKASQQDVGRFIQILNAGRQALLKIDAVLGEEFTSLDGLGTKKVVRVRLDPALINQENGSAYVLGTNLSFDTDIRIVEQTSVKYRVRDRDGSRNMDALLPRIPVGLDFDLKGSKIGDSVVIETGDDAGIYSIRRILSSMGDNDSLVLDRKLANSTVPDGTGNSSGLRYRVADELNVDLVTPKVIRIPLGDIFLGLDLNSVAGNKVVTSGGDTNFLLAGAQAGDTLEILEGDNRGKYSVVSVAGLSLELDSPVQNTAFSQEFSVYKAYKGIDRPLVRVKEIELLDSNSKTTGIKIPYGRPIDVRAIGLFSNRAEGVKTESFTGAVTALGYLLTDDEVDFEAEKITESFRVNIINTRNAGTYTIVEVGVGGDPHTIRVAPEAEGGSEFVEIATGVHYSVGLPSAGFVRFSFLQPTTMEIQTGLDGARLSFNESGSPRSFRFSEVEGYSLLPAPGSTDSRLRDLRVARLYGGPTDFDSIVELTDLGHPDAFGMEFMEGDILEVNEQLPFRTTKATAATCDWPSGTGATGTVTCTNTGGIYPNRWVRKNSSSPFFRVLNVTANTSFLVDNPNGLTFPGGSAISAICSTFEELGVFGKPAGLRTIAGSNRVWIPANSLMDFQAMNGVYPLAGQLLRIDSGPDAGEYVIEEVVDAKTLRLNIVMTSSTQTLTDNMRDLTPREVKPNTQLISSGSGSSTDLQDLTDAGGLGSTVGQYITIFESTRGDIDGAYKIKGLVSTGRVTLDVPLTKIPRPDTVGDAGYPDLDPRGVGPFSWMRSDSSTNIEQPFHVYRSVSIQAQVVQVATKRPDSVVGPKRGYTGIGTGGYNVRMTAANGTFSGVQAGDRLEVLSGPNSGVYPVSLVDTVLYSYVDIVYNPTNYFQVLASDIPFRVWGGLHGARTMMTVSSYESHNGRIYPGQLMLYQVVRPKIYHISSTDMAKNFDGIFYYADIQVESDGSGDEYNLTENSRLEVTESGLAAGKVKADGYIHDVDNANLTFSTFEQVSLIFSRRFLPVGNTDSPENRSEISGRNLQVSYEQSTTAKLVHDLLRSDTERPINANPLGRHFLPSYLFVNLVYRGGVSADIVGNDISDFVNSLGAEAQLEVSELEAYITRRGATSVDHPIEIATVTHDLDRNLVVDRSDNKLGGRNEVPYNGTGRTSAFFAILGEGLKVDRQS